MLSYHCNAARPADRWETLISVDFWIFTIGSKSFEVCERHCSHCCCAMLSCITSITRSQDLLLVGGGQRRGLVQVLREASRIWGYWRAGERGGTWNKNTMAAVLLRGRIHTTAVGVYEYQGIITSDGHEGQDIGRAQLGRAQRNCTSSVVSKTLPGAYLVKSCVPLGNCLRTP